MWPAGGWFTGSGWSVACCQLAVPSVALMVAMLPEPCIAPIVFVGNLAFGWFAATGS